MSAEITMPKLGLTMTTGTIVRWMKAPGERIELGEPLLEVSTEKISYEVESPFAGMLSKRIGKEGDEFPPGTVIGIVTTADEPSRTRQPAQALQAHASQATHAQPIRPNGSSGGTTTAARTIASPAARKLARERSIDVAAVRGSGPRGRVTLADVAAFADVILSPSTSSGQSPRAESKGPTELRYPPQLPANRRTIFRRMSEIGLLPLAQVETVANVDALKALIVRRGDFGWAAFTALAAARLLRDHPVIRTDARTGAPHPSCDIGIAVDTPNGLLVAALREADRRSLREIHEEIQRLARSAREGHLDLRDVGETAFTISNVGPQGVERVAPLVDPPQTAILGVGAATRRAAVVKTPGTDLDVVAPAWCLTLVLSFDHRFVDGAPAARFLAALAAALTEPGMLL